VRTSRAALDFEALYRAARDDVFAYVVTLLRDHAAAEDVTALAFERAYRKQKTFKPGRGSERAGCSGSPATPRSTSCAAASAPPRSPASRPTSDAESPEDAAETAVRRAAVRTALATLGPREREIVALKFHAGLDNAELAAVLGVERSAAGTQLHRAMTKLREAVAHA
jgi:RNA polymerase sigma-70 factor (ECF subfamily)